MTWDVVRVRTREEVVMAPEGWYPDPHGDHEHRYWDGQRWTEHVASFGVTLRDPSDGPLLPAVEQRVWDHGAHVLSTHRIWIDDAPGKRRGHPEPIALWAVQDVEVRPAKAATPDSGRITCTVVAPDYAGPRRRVLDRIPQAAVTAAWIRRWARRNQRARTSAW